jgi:hypothetical protein
MDHDRNSSRGDRYRDRNAEEAPVKLHSYPSIFNLGHRAVGDLLRGPVIVEEKVDGSQITFGVIDGQLCIRSKGAEVHVEAPEGMFANAVRAISAVAAALVPGWHYRGEYLQKPKHNTLAYTRTPSNHIVIFDIDRDGIGDFASREIKESEAARLGFDIIPELHRGLVADEAFLLELLQRESYLGGQIVEGVVIKPINYDLWGPDKKVLMGKFVREEFKEMNAKNFRTENPKQNDVLSLIGQSLRTEARWHKAVIHLRERGLIQGDPRDIGALLREAAADIEKECADDIKDRLYKWALPQIRRIATAGLPEWYKQQLLHAQFDESDTTVPAEVTP